MGESWEQTLDQGSESSHRRGHRRSFLCHGLSESPNILPQLTKALEYVYTSKISFLKIIQPRDSLSFIKSKIIFEVSAASVIGMVTETYSSFVVHNGRLI
jgi:hypothetical protein